ncbi:ribulokinase [Paenibacillus caui]|uniref:ribulokinase n=1 Tax=Paenibacillus caui TaxID=2873927 RepID=UPI001CA94086|nr:ribulokinase [Paenibacillus caui]
MNSKYTIGVDFGTESGRVLLVEVRTGKEAASSVTAYPHGVLERSLPDGTPLDKDWSLQHPEDYLAVLYRSIPEVLDTAHVLPEDVIGIGIDFTSCTILPTDGSGIPLCVNEQWKHRPHSWVKLWKHHAAQPEADEITALAASRKEHFPNQYGGKISSEWMFPKLLEVLRDDPEVYEAADLWLEAGDWMVFRLTGELSRSSSTSGFKALWSKREGYPDPHFLSMLDPRLANAAQTKLRGKILPLGAKAGVLTQEMAARLGLKAGTAVAVNIIDAHAAVPAVGAVRPGQLVMSMGTSTCHMLVSDREEEIEGICGVVEDGIIPGFYGYETGQAAVGDAFSWYVNQAVPSYVQDKAVKKGVSIHEWLEGQASRLCPGESGLIALDWWNGNRSVLVNANLSGLIVGLTLATRPEEIYRCMLESTAFGTRKILETFADAGLIINEIFACGGLPQKNNLLMQIYADVLNHEIKVADSSQITALGSAMYAAVAAGGWDNIAEAAQHMAKVKEDSYKPNPKNAKLYNLLYAAYLQLHDYFGRDSPAFMQQLKQQKMSTSSEVPE